MSTFRREGETIVEDNGAEQFEAPVAWKQARKTALTRVVRIDGPFRVLTREGPLDCPDGYLALDAQGDPYPIATDVFEASYEVAG